MHGVIVLYPARKGLLDSLRLLLTKDSVKSPSYKNIESSDDIFDYWRETVSQEKPNMSTTNDYFTLKIL